jgi:hypothetical protein
MKGAFEGIIVDMATIRIAQPRPHEISPERWRACELVRKSW